jgi:ATP-dependent DNA helicase RecQ
MLETPDTLTAALKHHFGFTAFHKGQREVIDDVVAGHPTVAVMPTGAGKSLCYQLPALLLDGITLVVSPLIALMKDQVDALRARGIAAEYVNSSQSYETQRAVMSAMTRGELPLVYVAPERFRSSVFRRALTKIPVALFAVDEAHCISRWGHDFRPDYARLGEVLAELQPPRVLACTATATPDVRDDIQRVLDLKAPRVHVAGFLRPNLFLEARLCGGDRDREARLRTFLTQGAGRDGAVIIYASTRKRVERFGAVCRGIVGHDQAVIYHAGLDDEERVAAQERFMSGRCRVVVATNAFGMGVDRADVRAVVHVNLPRTIEGYYQEVGRAGRDGAPSHCLLLFNPIDTRTHEFLIDVGHTSVADCGAVWARLLDADGAGVPPAVLDAVLQDRPGRRAGQTALRTLARAGAARLNDGLWFAEPGAPEQVRALGVDFDQIDTHRKFEHQKLDRMRRFVYSAECRHAQILNYFGEPIVDLECPGCGRCQDSAEGAVPGLVFGVPDEDELLLSHNTLAGVARAEGRFGLRKVAGMLAGSKAKGVGDGWLASLSTYGLLRAVGTEGCARMLHLLVDQRLCAVGGDKYPLLEITDAGWDVMQGRKVPGFKPPKELAPAKTSRRRKAPKGDDLDEGPAEVMAALRAFRTDEAKRRSVPAYVVFSDRTMRAIAAVRPGTEAEFVSVSGLGPARWASYGPRLVAALEAL